MFPSLATLKLAARAVLVRLRFPLLVAGIVLLLAAWPWLRHHFDRLTRARAEIDTSVSSDTEYWCPMCPGVISDWPEKCPVCHMALVRRKKGEATPLPDGVVARMQFSPYRVQLAGVRTTAVEYRALVLEITAAGRVARRGEELEVTIDVPEGDMAALAVGAEAEVTSESYPGQKFAARVGDLAGEVSPEMRSLRARLDLPPARELRPGMAVQARLRVPATRLPRVSRAVHDDWRERTAADLALGSLPALAVPVPGMRSLLQGAGAMALHHRGLALCVPATSVIDTGGRKVVFVESMPGMFDAVEVTLGRRCGEHYPVLGGLAAGQQVVTSGAFLLDAETRLNPALAASYFGAGRSHLAERPSAEDQQLIARQKTCPVMGGPLGSMGPPVRVVVGGRTVFLCCKGCEPELRRSPGKYLANLPKTEP